MEVTIYIEINLGWEYENRTVTFSMQNYVRKALHKFQHIHMVCKEYSPHICNPIPYVQTIQYAYPLDASEYVSNKETNFIEQVCETFLNYAIFINSTIIPSLSDISS